MQITLDAQVKLLYSFFQSELVFAFLDEKLEPLPNKNSFFQSPLYLANDKVCYLYTNHSRQ